MATSTRGLLLATWRPLRDAVPREIAPVDACSRPDPSPSSTTLRSDAGCLRDGAPPSSPDSTLRPRRTTRRTHAPPCNPRTDQIARPTHRRSSTEWLDTRRDRDHASTRRSRSPMRSPRRLGGSKPGPSPSPTVRSTSPRRSDRNSAGQPPRTPRHRPTGTTAPARSTSSAPPATMTKELDHLRETSSDSRGMEGSATRGPDEGNPTPM